MNQPIRIGARVMDSNAASCSSRSDLATVEEFAQGVIETTTAQAIRVISIERAIPARFHPGRVGRRRTAHACSLARALRVPRALIPALPVCYPPSGHLLADNIRDYPARDAAH